MGTGFKGYKIHEQDQNGKRETTLWIDDKIYKTYYSKKIIEKIIERKGLDRAPKYLSNKNERARYLQPLFNQLNINIKRKLRVLEVGCSSGHITEYLNHQESINEIHTFDIDSEFVEITKLKVKELNLDKVIKVLKLSNKTSLNLPYKDNYFDLVIVLAVVEHLPYENRHMYVDEYYRVLKLNGMIGFYDTPNKYFPIEMHSIGLPFVSLLPPQIAYIYARLFYKHYRKIDFPQFVRAGTVWRNSSYYELLPKTLMIDILDVSHEYGYISTNKLARIISKVSKVFGIPSSFFSPNLHVVFKKIKEYE